MQIWSTNFSRYLLVRCKLEANIHLFSRYLLRCKLGANIIISPQVQVGAWLNGDVGEQGCCQLSTRFSFRKKIFWKETKKQKTTCQVTEIFLQGFRTICGKEKHINSLHTHIKICLHTWIMSLYISKYVFKWTYLNIRSSFWQWNCNHYWHGTGDTTILKSKQDLKQTKTQIKRWYKIRKKKQKEDKDRWNKTHGTTIPEIGLKPGKNTNWKMIKDKTEETKQKEDFTEENKTKRR